MTENKFVRVCDVCRLEDLLNACIGLAVCNIIENRIGKHHRFLLNITDSGAEPAHIKGFYVLTVKQNLPVVIIIKAEEKIYKGRFTGAGRTDNADSLSRLNCQVDVRKDVFRLVKREADVTEFDLALQSLRNIALAVVMLRLGIENVHNSFRRSQRALIRVVESRKEVDGTVKHRSI